MPIKATAFTPALSMLLRPDFFRPVSPCPVKTELGPLVDNSPTTFTSQAEHQESIQKGLHRRFFLALLEAQMRSYHAIVQTYTLIHGNATNILSTLSASSVDALITDPPYSSGGLHAGAREADPVAKYGLYRPFGGFDGDSKDQRSWTRWCAEWLSLSYQALKPGSPIAVFTDWRQLPALTDAVQMADFVWRGIAVWDKTPSCRPQRGRPRNQCEYVVWGSKGAMPLDRAAPTIDGVHREILQKSDKHHLTGKPVALMRWLCQLCEPSGLILDPFAGSGTTGVAAVLDGFRFLGVERDAHYHQLATTRLAAAARGQVLPSLSDSERGTAARATLQSRRSRKTASRQPAHKRSKAAG